MASEKGRESEGKCKRVGTVERFPPRNFIHQPKKVSIQCLVWGFYSQTPFTKYQKKQNKYYYNGGKLGRKPKSDKEVKKSKAGNMNSGWKLEQCVGNGKFAGCEGCENSQPVKFCSVVKIRNLRNFAGCENFAILPNFTASLFLLLSAPFSSGF